MIGSLVREGIEPRSLHDTGVAPADAFRAFVEAHLDEAYRLATHILGVPADAEDAVHDAAIAAWRHWPDRRDPARTEAWFRRIVVNACRDRIRANARVRLLPGGLEVGGGRHPIVADGSQLIHDRDALQRLLARLDVDERVLLTLRYGLDLTVPAIAAVLGTREGTVKSRLHRALRRARIELEREP
ncbi:MAG TPA: sigma-70 family RNA polymerase sigma factor [Candidatus Limnocylindrales bacterium]|jgi:RNA polymerase sigma-70 factor (ECF subfamily)